MVEIVPRRKQFESLDAGFRNRKVLHFGESDGNGGRLDDFRDARGGGPGENEEEEADCEDDATNEHDTPHGQSGKHHKHFILLVVFAESAVSCHMYKLEDRRRISGGPEGQTPNPGLTSQIHGCTVSWRRVDGAHGAGKLWKAFLEPTRPVPKSAENPTYGKLLTVLEVVVLIRAEDIMVPQEE